MSDETRIDNLTLMVNVAGAGDLVLTNVGYETEAEEWILYEENVDSLVRKWADRPGCEAEWVSAASAWAMAKVTIDAPGLMPNLSIGVWTNYEEDGQWSLDGFPFNDVFTNTAPPAPAVVEPEAAPHPERFRLFGEEVAATLALWSQAEFDGDQMVADIGSMGKRHLGLSLETYATASLERQAMWNEIAGRHQIEGPDEDQIRSSR